MNINTAKVRIKFDLQKYFFKISQKYIIFAEILKCYYFNHRLKQA